MVSWTIVYDGFGQIFYIEVEIQLSYYGEMSCAVPQGSILGPLMFFIYVNGMSQATKSNVFLCADDSKSRTNIEMSKKSKNN